MKRKVLVLLCLIFAAAIIFSGCGSSTRSADKDSVTIAVISEWTSLDPPYINNTGDQYIIQQLFDGLVRVNSDNSVEPGLATHWDMSSDGLEFVFHLRPNIKFHNGDPITPEDVVFTYTRAIANPAASRVTGAIDRAEVVDDNKVKIILKHPYLPFIPCTGMGNLGIVPKKVVEEMGDAAFGRNPVGSGPYKAMEWRPGDRLIMEAFEDYWRGPAPIKNAEFRIILDSTATTIALERGEIDVIYSVIASEREILRNNPKINIVSAPMASPMFLAHNMRDGRFANNPLLRRAVAHAINREEIIAGALEGEGDPIYAPFAPSAFGYPTGYIGHQYDPARSRELIAQAGYPNGIDITLRTFERPDFARPAEIVQEQLRRAGFNCRLDLMEWGAFMTDVFTNGQYELLMTNLGALVLDSDFHAYIRFHSQFPGGVNITYVRDAELDRLVEIGRFSTVPAEREAAFRGVAERNNELNVTVPIFVAYIVVASVEGLGGVKPYNTYIQHIYDMYWE